MTDRHEDQEQPPPRRPEPLEKRDRHAAAPPDPGMLAWFRSFVARMTSADQAVVGPTIGAAVARLQEFMGEGAGDAE